MHAINRLLQHESSTDPTLCLRQHTPACTACLTLPTRPHPLTSATLTAAWTLEKYLMSWVYAESLLMVERRGPGFLCLTVPSYVWYNDRMAWVGANNTIICACAVRRREAARRSKGVNYNRPIYSNMCPTMPPLHQSPGYLRSPATEPSIGWESQFTVCSNTAE